MTSITSGILARMDHLLTSCIAGLTFLVLSLLTAGCGASQEGRDEPGAEAWEDTAAVVLPVERLADLPMPVPVDDTVALAYRDRYVYLVSGWHETGNVNLVQLYDSATDTWRQATPWPGEPVFGHAGGIVGDTLVIAGGMRARQIVTGEVFRFRIPARG